MAPWVTVLSRHIEKEGDIKQIYFCVILLKTRNHALAHITSGAFIHCAFSLAAKEHTRQHSCVHDFACQCLL